ncbi:hypothetical protein CXG81DRAFT_10276 [Caulochytrium protostelioides]|uniref:Uncharacterized protein n=1 Tax=Caulochytrium protostelioides TaxID=1555241 RepID=A0A4P9XBU0_9FUNG|nr:hypothetical protein CXG81DRAFT_10276 [Caulochytrium protostelioides]|eukprot:RKP02878.1 hypothetical protein CXG81DRAFT_10276 [Caulochytrium protostelioides]
MSRSTAKSLTPLVGTKKFITAKDEYSFKGRRLTGRILHITDMHIDQFYKAHSDPKQACHRFNVDPSRNVAGPYGHLGIKCDAPVSLINATFDFLTASGLNDVDMVIYTGDTARHDWDKTELPRTAEQALEAHHIALDRMLNAFDTSKIPIITTIGNNDPLVSEVLSYGSQEIYQQLGDMWSKLGLGIEKQDSFKKGGYFVYEFAPTLNVISLNSMFFFTYNTAVKSCRHGTPGAGMLDWLKQQLRDARDSGKRVWLMSHVEMTDQAGRHEYYPDCEEKYTTLLVQYADTITGHFHGHDNSDHISYVYLDDMNTYHTESVTANYPYMHAAEDRQIAHFMLNAPSITTAKNPGVRTYKYDVETMALTDYTQYWTDLYQDNLEGRVMYRKEYTFSEAFGNDLSHDGLTKTVREIQKGGVAFDRYIQYMNVTGVFQ